MKIFLEKTYGVKQQTVEIQDSRCLFLLLFKVMNCQIGPKISSSN